MICSPQGLYKMGDPLEPKNSATTSCSYPGDALPHFIEEIPKGIEFFSPSFVHLNCFRSGNISIRKFSSPFSVLIFIFVCLTGFRKQVYWICLACHLRLCDYVCLNGCVSVFVRLNVLRRQVYWICPGSHLHFSVSGASEGRYIIEHIWIRISVLVCLNFRVSVLVRLV